jgi:hypothetical protein
MANLFDVGWRAGWHAAMNSLDDEPSAVLERLVTFFPDALLTPMDADTLTALSQVSRASRNAVRLSAQPVAGRHEEVPLQLEDYIDSIERLEWALLNGAHWKAGIVNTIMTDAPAEKVMGILMWVLRRPLPFDWCGIMRDACIKGDLGAVNMLIELAKKEAIKHWRADREIESGFRACLVYGHLNSNHLAVAEQLLRYAILRDSMLQDKVYDCLQEAFGHNGDPDGTIVDSVAMFLLQKHIVPPKTMDYIMALACMHESWDLVDWLCADEICSNEHMAHISCYLSSALFYNHMDIAETLLENGLDVDFIAADGRTALVHVIRWFRPLLHEHGMSAVQFLLGNNAELNMKDSIQTPLQAAAEKGHTEVVELLLERGAIIDLKNAQGQTALMVATTHGRAQVASQLLDKGANVSLRDNNGDSARAIALRCLDNSVRTSSRLSRENLLNVLNLAIADHDLANSRAYRF